MLGRTGWSCLVVGVFIAVPSGVGVALAVLGGNQAGGVGVAISASLLPPAVNTGLLFAMSLISSLTDTNMEQQVTSEDSDMVGLARTVLRLRDREIIKIFLV